MLPVSLIMLAIQAGVRLYSGLREAYVASIKQSTITLPLPDAPDIRLVASVDFIINSPAVKDPGQVDAFKQQLDVVLPLATAFDEQHKQLSPDQQRLVITFHDHWFAALDATSGYNKANAEDPITSSKSSTLALLSVRQWASSQADPPAWQIGIGTLIDVAVFWFANDPGAISTSRPAGKALQAFLHSFQTVDFAHAGKAKLASDLMVAMLDTVANQPNLIVGGQKETALVTASTKALADAIQKIPPATLDGLFSGQSEQLTAVLGTTLSATLRAGADTVLTNPKLFFIGSPESPETAVMEHVSKVFVDLVLPTFVGGQTKIDLARAVSPAGLETLMRATLAAVGNNPGILHVSGDTERRLSPLLADLAASFSNAAVPTNAQAAFAEVAAIVVSATDRHMDTLWPNNNLDPAQNLARGAAVAALDTLTQNAGGGSGFAAFSSQDVVSLANAVIASVADNPALMSIKAPGADPYLTAALSAMLKALKQQSVAKLSTADVVTIVTAGISAAVRKLQVLQDAGGAASAPIGGLLDAVFGAIGDVKQNGSDAAKWQVTGTGFIVDVIKILFDKVATLPGNTAITAAKLMALRATLNQFAAKGESLTALPDLIATALA